MGKDGGKLYAISILYLLYALFTKLCHFALVYEEAISADPGSAIGTIVEFYVSFGYRSVKLIIMLFFPKQISVFFIQISRKVTYLKLDAVAFPFEIAKIAYKFEFKAVFSRVIDHS